MNKLNFNHCLIIIFPMSTKSLTNTQKPINLSNGKKHTSSNNLFPNTPTQFFFLCKRYQIKAIFYFMTI